MCHKGVAFSLLDRYLKNRLLSPAPERRCQPKIVAANPMTAVTAPSRRRRPHPGYHSGCGTRAYPHMRGRVASERCRGSVAEGSPGGSSMTSRQRHFVRWRQLDDDDDDNNDNDDCRLRNYPLASSPCTCSARVTNGMCSIAYERLYMFRKIYYHFTRSWTWINELFSFYDSTRLRSKTLFVSLCVNFKDCIVLFYLNCN